jgi:hypothetical protein
LNAVKECREEGGVSHWIHSDERACWQVLRLISGLPSRERAARVLSVIQVAIDDSNRGQEDSPAFVLAGFMGRAENWADFADDWQGCLEEDPPIPLLKGRDAINLEKHFKGWTEDERDARLLRFIEIISGHVFASIRLAIRKSDFDRILKQPSGAMKKMYALPTSALVTRTLDFALDRKMGQTFEFVFDTNIMSPNQLRNMYKGAIADLPYKAARIIKGFRHDTDDNFYPIQAADLFASYVRDELLALSEGREFRSRVYDALMKIRCVDVPLNADVLMNIRHRIQKRLGQA